MRSVYRNASASTEAARSVYLDSLSADPLAATARGTITTGVSAGGHNWSGEASGGSSAPLELIEWARDYIAPATIAEALALIPPPVRFFSRSFQSFSPA